MKKSVVLLSAVACLCAYPQQGRAETEKQLLHRLEAKIDALAKENAALRQRVKKVESSSHKAASAAPAAAAPKTSETGTYGVASIPKSALSANAAYIPVKAAAPARAPCANFGGGYVGVQGGWANLDSNWVDRDAWVDNFGNDWALGTVNNNKGGASIGGQAGYNMQRGCTLWGAELDANWTNISWDKFYTPTSNPGTALELSSKLNWYGTARLRTGVIVDNLLLYVTGGFAYARLRHDFTITDPNVLVTRESFSADKDRWGGAVGVGTEWQWNEHWSLKSDFLYIRLKSVETTGFSAAGNQTVHFDNNDSIWASRIGLNYRY